jgi:hypothetical protein
MPGVVYLTPNWAAVLLETLGVKKKIGAQGDEMANVAAQSLREKKYHAMP